MAAVSLGEWCGPQVADLAAAGKAATLARGGLFKVTGRASPNISSLAACSAHRCRLSRYATPVAGLSVFKRISGERGWLPGGGGGRPGIRRLE